MLTDRDERALLSATENRVADPLRLATATGAALAAVRRLLRRERESVACHPTPPRTQVRTRTAPDTPESPPPPGPLPR